MKKMIWVALATIAVCCACRSTRVTNTAAVQPGLLLGQHPVRALLDTPYANWFQKEYNTYAISDTSAARLASAMKQKRLVIFYGTWCGDSRREVPRLYKLLDRCGVSTKQVTLVAVNNEDSVYKQSPGGEEIGLNIHRVPTLLVYDQQMEIGRIVETPIVSWEDDLKRILTRQSYVPRYRAVPVLDRYIKQMPADSLSGCISSMAQGLKPILPKAGELNTYGYILMGQRQLEAALFVFQVNAVLFPKNANVFDSLGECYEKLGQPSAALEQYQRAVLLDPKQIHAPERIRVLQTNK
jgi:tetratricopeptide (TPR) repeat protein